MSVAAVIPAAGNGKRMNSNIAKQYISLQGRPVIYYSIKAFEESNIDQIIIVTAPDLVSYMKAEVNKYSFKKVTRVVAGGAERFDSVYAGLCAVTDAEYVLIHDGVRPFVSTELINSTIEKVQEYDACVVGVPSKDTVKLVDAIGRVISTPDRSGVWIAQTPQAFKYEIILKAHKLLQSELRVKKIDKSEITDDAMLVERYTGYRTYMLQGDYRNIKLTTPEDIAIAEALLVVNRV